LICTSSEKGQKTGRMQSFLPVSEARSNKLYIFRQCTHILYANPFKKNEDAKLE